MDDTTFDREKILNIIFHCEQALNSHQKWHNSIIRSLICRLPSDSRDTNKNGHKECNFGQWYYATQPKTLQQHPNFIALERTHKKMHQLARKLLINYEQNASISPHQYDAFAKSIEEMRLELETLQRDLSEFLYNHDPLTGLINRTSMISVLKEHQSLVEDISKIAVS